MKGLKIVIGLLISIQTGLFSQNQFTLYLIPGQGSDERIFKNLVFDDFIDTVQIHYPLPRQNESMHNYAVRVAALMDTTKPYGIIGISLGGMIACEITDILDPDVVIIISSAASSEEVPELYKFFRRFHVYEEISPALFKYSTYFLQPAFERDRNTEKETCKSMLHEKDALFIKRAVGLIVSWNRTSADNEGKNIIHIHGDIDNTLPISNIKADHIIKNGSHMMALTKAEEISEIVNSILINYKFSEN